MSERGMGRAYEEIIAAVGHGDDAVFDRLIAADLVDHNPVPGQDPGRAGFRAWAAAMREAFPDLTGAVEDTVVDGNKVAARVTWRGTHRGVFVGIPGSGTRVEIQAVHIVWFTDGLASEWWGTADIFGALTQMGARITPPPR